MENPHAERQGVLLQRILNHTEKCAETITQINNCLNEIIKDHAPVKTAADLATKYRRNVQYNLEATKGDRSGDTTVGQ
ncbi:hypothetical protein B0H16DRAFT_1536817 [Mycena metata]|uniref:DASH complex subunit DAD4 n=1 Tax=Mycena metata TaxID=1033252 RepID=A0AAD7J5A8_9AGAR|nr:hypothetical protein B0H16DRAFT_1536817 [Mycena metata]